MKSTIAFANKERLTINENEIIFTIGKNANGAATVTGEFLVKALVKPSIISSIMTAILKEEYFYLSSNPLRIYNSKMIVSIESE